MELPHGPDIRLVLKDDRSAGIEEGAQCFWEVPCNPLMEKKGGLVDRKVVKRHLQF